jgi:hypothetical protein
MAGKSSVPAEATKECTPPVIHTSQQLSLVTSRDDYEFDFGFVITSSLLWLFLVIFRQFHDQT